MSTYKTGFTVVNFVMSGAHFIDQNVANFIHQNKETSAVNVLTLIVFHSSFK